MALPALQAFTDMVTTVVSSWLNRVDLSTTPQTDTGVVNAYVIQNAPVATAGTIVTFIPANTNTGAVTVNGATAIRANGTACTGGEFSSLGPIVLQSTGTQWQIVSTAGAQPGFERTAAEISNGIVPVAPQFAVGSLRRYGADPLGLVDSSTALANACACNADVFDDYPGGGTYLLNAETVISTMPITVRGQTRTVFGNQVNVVGTTFKLMTVAGPGAAALRTAAFHFGLSVRDIGFAWQSINLGQFAIHSSSDLRNPVIERCFFQGGGAGSTNVAIKCDFASGGTFTGSGSIRDNYFSNCPIGIWLRGPCTTLKIYGNEFIGYTGSNAVNSLGAITPGSLYTNGFYPNVPLTGGVGTGARTHITIAGGLVTQVVLVDGGKNYGAGNTLSATAASLGGTGSGFSIPVATVGTQGGDGIRMDYSSTEVKINDNYFEGFLNGINANGAASVQQVGNDFQVSPNGFVWAQLPAGAISTLGALTPGSLYTNGFYPNVPLTGGAGNSATANITIKGGAVIAVEILSGGNTYAATNVLSAAAANIGGTGSGFAIVVSSVTNFNFTGNQSMGDLGVGGFNLGYSNLDASQTNLAGRAGWLATGGAIQSTRGFQEGGGAGSNLRSFSMGYGQTTAGTFSASGAMTWNAAGNVTWSLIGKTLTVSWNFFNTTIGGVADKALQILLPNSLVSAETKQVPCAIQNNGAFSNNGSAAVVSGAGNTLIKIYIDPSGSNNWTLSPANGGSSGSITLMTT